MGLTMEVDQKKLTRLEVIDETGRVLTRRPCAVELSVQDGGTTLKVFVTGGKPRSLNSAKGGMKL